MKKTHKVTLIHGDGIGSEVIVAAKQILFEAGGRVEWEECLAGSLAFQKGISSGIPQDTLDSIAKNKVALKGPLSTPIGYGEKSANVTLRKYFDTYANIRPIKQVPGIHTRFGDVTVDFTIVRENVEDLYTGIEHMQTSNTAQCLKLISKSGCERIVRLAFEIAKSENRQTIHCATKANIMKLTEGMMKHVFEEIAPHYSGIQPEHILVDNCAHQMVMHPQQFELIVTTNMNGDILSDLGSGLIGGLGLSSSANMGDDVAIFEAVHGSAPQIAGQNKANPVATVLSSVMMLRHLEEFETASIIENAIYYTLSQGIATYDISDNNSVSTAQFTTAVIKNLGKSLQAHETRPYATLQIPKPLPPAKILSTTCIGMDMFIQYAGNAQELAKEVILMLKDASIHLHSIANRGLKVYPSPEVCVKVNELYCVRLLAKEIHDALPIDQIASVIALLSDKLNWVHIEKLHQLNGINQFTDFQGE